MTLLEALQTVARLDQLFLHEPLSKYTTFRVGGSADILFLPETEEQLVFAVRAAHETRSPLTVIGNGSNLLVKDGGIRGLVIRLGEAFGGTHIDGTLLTARAGELLSCASHAALSASLTGLEFASGIPGSVGGAMAMNAGAYGGQMSDVAESCRILNLQTGEISEIQATDMNLGYRTSLPLQTGNIVTTARLRLSRGNADEIRARMDELNARRRDKQPLTQPSAGSTFKRPEGHFAGALIENAGLKGTGIGGAQVSPKHAGFIVNTGNATAKDILELIHLVQTRVFDMSGVLLEPEVRILGED